MYLPSANTLRILFDIDITQLNIQWVNHGAGVWAVSADGLYPWVDSSLLTGLTAQSITNVGSVLIDSEQMTQSGTLLACSDNESTFYWDGSTLYIHPTHGDSPFMHTINIGVVYGFSREGFTPVGGLSYYESRLLGVPSISQARDPLFYGKLQYEGGRAELNNGDGDLDQLGEDNNAYGNQARVSIGTEDLPATDYERIFTGYVETIDIDEQQVSVSFRDKRKQLSKKVTYSCTSKNALDAIVEILNLNYGIPYNGLYYNTSLWETARALVPVVTADYTSPTDTIEIIQKICESAFGLFLVDTMGRYSFKVVRSGDAASHVIPGEDVINEPRATYDPSEVITSTKIGYAKDWATSGSAYTYLNDTSQEAAIFQKYKTYNERTFDTLLDTLSDAQAFSDIILDGSGTIRPRIEVEVPIAYYQIEVGDFVEIEINRPNATWFGERKCEVIGKGYNLDRGTITLTVRKYGDEIAYRATTDGYMRVTTNNETRKVGA